MNRERIGSWPMTSVACRREALDAEREVCVVDTPSATYRYDMTGGGFGQLLDGDGRDWIGYRDGGGPAGEYRGIPNLVHRDPEHGFFHAGHRGARGAHSQVLEAGPQRVVLDSVSADEGWQVRWEIDAQQARLQVLRSDADDPTYWCLYEGTPGGVFDPASSRCLRSGGEVTGLDEAWEADGEAAPGWAAFTDPQRRRALWLQARTPARPVMYRPMPPMTVFGFGRGAEGVASYLRGVGEFRIGLVEAADVDGVARHIEELP